MPKLLFPQLFSGHDVEGYHARSVLDLVDAVAVDDGRRKAAQKSFELPFEGLDFTLFATRSSMAAKPLPISLVSRFSSPCGR